MVREEARRTLLREYDKWAKDHPDDAIKRGGVVFFTYLQKDWCISYQALKVST